MINISNKIILSRKCKAINKKTNTSKLMKNKIKEIVVKVLIKQLK